MKRGEKIGKIVFPFLFRNTFLSLIIHGEFPRVLVHLEAIKFFAFVYLWRLCLVFFLALFCFTTAMCIYFAIVLLSLPLFLDERRKRKKIKLLMFTLQMVLYIVTYVGVWKKRKEVETNGKVVAFKSSHCRIKFQKSFKNHLIRVASCSSLVFVLQKTKIFVADF